mgnify:CR=1 FL=1
MVSCDGSENADNTVITYEYEIDRYGDHYQSATPPKPVTKVKPAPQPKKVAK